MIMKAIEIPQIINQRQSERGWKKLNFFCTSRRPQVATKRGWLHYGYICIIYIYIYIYRIVPDSICHDNTTNECRMQFSAKNLFCPMTFTFIPACLHIQHTLCTYYSFCSVACNLELRQSATRESCLGLGRNGNRNRMGDGSGSGSGWGAASGRVKVAAKTKAKVMTFWQPSRKCLV